MTYGFRPTPALSNPLEPPLGPARFESGNGPGARHVLEVLGPAGAGKTTFVAALRERHPIREQLFVPWPRRLVAVGGIMWELLVPYLCTWPHTRWFNIEELRRLCYVTTWHRALAQTRSEEGSITVLDHGPIFMLGMVQEFGPECARTPQFARWVKAAITAWSVTLDMIVWLDAPDRTLARRIDRRQRYHSLKGKAFAETCLFLSRCRRAFERILADITAQHRVKVLRFDTSETLPHEIAQGLLKALRSAQPDSGRAQL